MGMKKARIVELIWFLFTPVLVASSPFALAQKLPPDWVAVTQGDQYYYAATLNDSGSVLGQWCYFASGNCLYLIGMTSRCDGDKPYPVLANSDAGAQTLQIKCGGPFVDGNGVTRYRYMFTDFDAIDSIVRKATNVGFAMPLQDGHFNVVRFTLNSSNAEIDSMRAAALARMNAAPKQGHTDTHDVKL